MSPAFGQLKDWTLVLEPHSTNKGAILIAQIVVKDTLKDSYRERG